MILSTNSELIANLRIFELRNPNSASLRGIQKNAEAIQYLYHTGFLDSATASTNASRLKAAIAIASQ